MVQYLNVSVNDEQSLKSKTPYSGTQQQHKCKNKNDWKLCPLSPLTGQATKAAATVVKNILKRADQNAIFWPENKGKLVAKQTSQSFLLV